MAVSVLFSYNAETEAIEFANLILGARNRRRGGQDEWAIHLERDADLISLLDTNPAVMNLVLRAITEPPYGWYRRR